jgi:hypothetical protein
MFEAFFTWVLYNLVPQIFIYLGVRLMGRWLPFTSLKMRLLPPFTLTDQGRNFLLYQICVKNTGRKNALECWPVLQSYPKQLDSSFVAQPIAWDEAIRSDWASIPFEAKTMQPNEERAFTFIFTSEEESENGAYVANVQIARRNGNHRIILFPEGTYVVKVGVIGSNIYARPLTLRMQISEAGEATWRTLMVQKWSIKDRLIHKAFKTLRK